MVIQRLFKDKPVHVRVKKGMTIECKGGIVWMTACGEDFILRSGEKHVWKSKCSKLIVMPLQRDALVALSAEQSLLEEFSLFNHQARFSAAFAG